MQEWAFRGRPMKEEKNNRNTKEMRKQYDFSDGVRCEGCLRFFLQNLKDISMPRLISVARRWMPEGVSIGNPRVLVLTNLIIL